MTSFYSFVLPDEPRTKTLYLQEFAKQLFTTEQQTKYMCKLFKTVGIATTSFKAHACISLNTDVTQAEMGPRNVTKQV